MRDRVLVSAVAEDRIVSDAQLTWFRDQMKGDGPIVVGSSVPLFQTKLIDVGLFIGTRQVTQIGEQIERNIGGSVTAGQASANIFEFLRRAEDFETISAFPLSWLELLDAIQSCRRVVWVAGDIHFSAIHHGKVGTDARRSLLTHVVSSGFRHYMADDAFRFVGNSSDILALIQRGLSSNPAVAEVLDGAQVRVTLGADAVTDALALADAVGRMVPPLDTSLLEVATKAGAIDGDKDVTGGVTRVNNAGMLSFDGRTVVVNLGLFRRGGFYWYSNRFA